ncbi:MAG: AAA family ATPase, partial [Propionicimonas sp.]|nr:AAA family ATPase [Propionicimonas sp.]
MPAHQLLARRIFPVVRARMFEAPVVLLEGPRSVGKSTLLRELAMAADAPVTDLDDPATADSVRADSSLFASGPAPVCIDEYQKAPIILDAIKARLNLETRPGMYLLAGSTRFDALPQIAQSLTGRLHRIPVMPFTQTEIDRTDNRLLEQAFSGDIQHRVQPSSTSRADYIARVTAGGYPLALAQPTPAARSRWFADQIRLTLERDARETRGFANAAALRTLLTRLAGQT